VFSRNQGGPLMHIIAAKRLLLEKQMNFTYALQLQKTQMQWLMLL
jgi:glycine/serine hydroxymethyltransferase